MALYNPNRRGEFRIKLGPIMERRGLDAKGEPNMVKVWEPDEGETPEIWGTGEIGGDIDRKVRAASDIVHVLPDGTTEETVIPAHFQSTLYEEWMTHPATRCNLTHLVDTGMKNEDGAPIMEERSIELNATTIHDPYTIHPYHQAEIKAALARNFYPEMFGESDPNSSKNGKSGTTGCESGSESGSKRTRK